MNAVTNYILAGLGGIMLAWIGSKITRYLDKRIKVSTPSERALDHIVPMVNMLARVQGPMLVSIEALLEATKGKCNGNIDEALEVMKEARRCYDSYVTNRLEIPSK